MAVFMQQLDNTLLLNGISLLDAIFAFAILLGGVAIAKIASLLFRKLRAGLGFAPPQSRLNSAHLLEIAIILVAAIYSLARLNVALAETLTSRFAAIAPSLLLFLIIVFIGFVLITITIDLIRDIFLRIAREYLKEYDISVRFISSLFLLGKIFLTLIAASGAMRLLGIQFPIFDFVLTAAIIILLLIAATTIVYAFRDYAANFLLSTYISRNVVKVGQHVRLGEQTGKVSTITGHGTVIDLDSGYSVLVPNSRMVRETILVKRISGDVHRIEPIVSTHSVALSSQSGPACVSLMLDFFGYRIEPKKVLREATEKRKAIDRVPEGEGTAETAALIAAARALTEREVRGKYIPFNSQYSLRTEIQSWLTEDALVMIVLPSKDDYRSVLVVGVEEHEFIILDPMMQTQGTYLLNHKDVEAALKRKERPNGYIVFAKKGSSAYWRLTEGLYYGELSAYQSISKAFERYLRKAVRESRMVNAFISPHVASRIGPTAKEKPRWKPDLSKSSKRK